MDVQRTSRRRPALPTVDELIDALLWCGGSADFAPGGIARVGWRRGPARLIRQYTDAKAAMLRQARREGLGA